MKLLNSFKKFMFFVFIFSIILISWLKIRTHFHSHINYLSNLSKNYFGERNYIDYIDEKIKQDINKFEFNIQRLKCEKWIILTSVNYPTEHIKYMKDALHGWCLLVLGDTKSPHDWNYKDTIYLSVYDQLKLAGKFKIIHMIPFKSYLRKMIGYLYAIYNGAEYIYETDDDNSPLDGLFSFRYKKLKGLELDCLSTKNQSENLFINPYSYFGQPSMWPRGYPLNMISENIPQKPCKKYKIYESSTENGNDRIPLIQQGLVNGDPDVDAIYRLTRKRNSQALNVKFDENSPFLVLNKNQYAPTNSQNTFFHYDAFWSLIFPLNVTFRECDILRGYISIRLMQEINGRVAFLSSNAFQERNAHSYHIDYMLEKRLYETIHLFVSDLNNWECNKLGFKDCFIDCIKMLIEKKHLNEIELEFYNKWISDLDSIGYMWPEILKNKRSMITEDLSSIYYKAIEQEHSSNSNENEPSSVMINSNFRQNEKIDNICRFKYDKAMKPDKLEKILLVTFANNKKELEFVNSFLSIHFPYVIVCMTNTQSDLMNIDFNDYLLYSSGFTIIQLLDNINLKYKRSICIQKAIQIGFKQQSLVFINNASNLYFWESDLVIESIFDASKRIDFNSDMNTDLIERNLKDNTYFIRRNVGNGVKILKTTGNHTELKNYCSFYSNNIANTILYSFNKAIEKLRWHSNDLASENCENIESKTVLIPDWHEGTITDIASTLFYLGQNPIKGRANNANLPISDLVSYVSKIQNESNFVRNYHFITPLKEDMVKENFEFYKKLAAFQQTDMVICSFIASMCEAFIPLNKTIIFDPAHRYNIGRCSETSWIKLNDNLLKVKAKSKLVVAAMSKYDREYLAHFTGLRGYRLYGYSGFFIRNVEYNPIRNEILIGPTSRLGNISSKALDELKAIGIKNNLKFEILRTFYKSYTYNQLASHPAVVIFPYSVMSMSIIDFYAINLPIFVPSIKFLTKTRAIFDRTLQFEYFCNNFTNIEPHITSIHKYNPNDENDEPYMYWLKYADFFQWPYVTVFDDFDDLIQKLKTVDLKKISEKMKAYNKIKETDLLDNWCQIIKKTQKFQPIPNSYKEALDYFNITHVQIY